MECKWSTKPGFRSNRLSNINLPFLKILMSTWWGCWHSVVCIMFKNRVGVLFRWVCSIQDLKDLCRNMKPNWDRVWFLINFDDYIHFPSFNSIGLIFWLVIVTRPFISHVYNFKHLVWSCGCCCADDVAAPLRRDLMLGALLLFVWVCFCFSILCSVSFYLL